MIKKWLTIGILSLCLTLQAVETMDEVFKQLDQADTETWVVFDIDMVLTQPTEPLYQMANMKRHKETLKKIMQEIPEENLMIFLTLISLQSDALLLDNRLPSFIQELNKKGVITMALTANLTGRFQSIESLEKRKVAELQKLGIDFTHSRLPHQPIIFAELPTYRGNYSIYTDGILFVNGVTCTKGEALVAFLTKQVLKPKKIIFIDDRKENLKSVEQSLQEFDPAIEYTSIHFEGAKNYPSQEVSAAEFEKCWRQIAQKTLSEQF